jgi:hypothetical protein
LLLLLFGLLHFLALLLHTTIHTTLLELTTHAHEHANGV